MSEVGDSCQRCGIKTIINECSGSFVMDYSKSTPEIITVLQPCDNPSHPEGCQIKQTFCYTDLVCKDCVHGFHQFGTETHPETYEHTLVHEDAGSLCTFN